MQINDMDNNFGLICNCAVRYALGRQTYVTSSVPQFIKENISLLDNRTIGCMERDLREADNYGDEKIDKPTWMNLLARLQEEMAVRNLKPW